jgi:hypothetical protein
MHLINDSAEHSNFRDFIVAKFVCIRVNGASLTPAATSLMYLKILNCIRDGILKMVFWVKKTHHFRLRKEKKLS